MLSNLTIFSAICCSRKMYPLYLVRISAASIISLRRGSFAMIRSSSFWRGTICGVMLSRLICGRPSSSSSLHPWRSGVVPNSSRAVFIRVGFREKLAAKLMMLSIFSFFEIIIKFFTNIFHYRNYF